MPELWYVLRSKPRQEELLWQQVRERALEVFYPCITVRPVNPRARKIVPYFPGYMFVRFDIDRIGLTTFQWMPFALGLVCFDNVPADVPDELITMLRSHIERIEASKGHAYPTLKTGERVIIQSGPFAGYEALFDRHLHGSDRVRVLLTLLSKQQVSIDIGVKQLSSK